jgi:hypothetical protein
VPGGDGEYRRYAAMREALKPNLGLAYGLPTIDGYDGGLLPTRDYARFKSLLVADEPPVPHYTLGPQAAGHAAAGVLGALNVRYLLTDGRHGEPGAGWIAQPEAPGAAWLYRNEAPLPRAFVSHDIDWEPDAEAALRLLARLDLARTAIVDVQPGLLWPEAAPGGAAPAAVRPARIVRYSPHEVEIEAEAAGRGLLVLTDSFYPGWRATVDRRPAPLVRANALFRGVPLPDGSHRVRMWFDSLAVKLGLGISAFALLGNALGVASWLRALGTGRHRAR